VHILTCSAVDLARTRTASLGHAQFHGLTSSGSVSESESPTQSTLWESHSYMLFNAIKFGRKFSRHISILWLLDAEKGVRSVAQNKPGSLDRGAIPETSIHQNYSRKTGKYILISCVASYNRNLLPKQWDCPMGTDTSFHPDADGSFSIYGKYRSQLYGPTFQLFAQKRGQLMKCEKIENVCR
jgi:hypothetical protein